VLLEIQLLRHGRRVMNVKPIEAQSELTAIEPQGEFER
jgi:hypothetical protein